MSFTRLCLNFIFIYLLLLNISFAIDICAEHVSQYDCEDVCCSWDEGSLTCADTDEGLPACASTCIGYDDWPEVSCLEDICGFLEDNPEDSECVGTCDLDTMETFEFFAEISQKYLKVIKFLISFNINN